MPGIPCFQVDAFAFGPFTGNPAAVCWLEQPAPTSWMQAVAGEMNLSETAFVRRLSGGTAPLELRWFTPEVEVDLCGHATLATAHALWTEGLVKEDPLSFQTRSGVITCRHRGELIELDFPATPPQPTMLPAELIAALGVTPRFGGKSVFDYFVEVESAEIVRQLRPDFTRLRQVPCRGVIVTALADNPEYDFVSRFFAPAVGVDEDPVCGSAHCAMTPYWAERLGKQELRAFQASRRGGDLFLRWNGDRVLLAGRGMTALRGTLLTPHDE